MGTEQLNSPVATDYFTNPLNKQEKELMEYYGRTFSDWKLAAFKYAKKNLSMDYASARRMATDLAWESEDEIATELTLEKAYLNWVLGTNPYSEHYTGNKRLAPRYLQCRQAKTREAGLYFDARRVGLSFPEAARFSFDVSLQRGISLAYLHSMYFPKLLQEWESGENQFSPHHVPLEEENIKSREERYEELKAKHPEVPGWQFELAHDKALLGSFLHKKS